MLTMGLPNLFRIDEIDELMKILYNSSKMCLALLASQSPACWLHSSHGSFAITTQYDPYSLLTVHWSYFKTNMLAKPCGFACEEGSRKFHCGGGGERLPIFIILNTPMYPPVTFNIAGWKIHHDSPSYKHRFSAWISQLCLIQPRQQDTWRGTCTTVPICRNLKLF